MVRLIAAARDPSIPGLWPAAGPAAAGRSAGHWCPPELPSAGHFPPGLPLAGPPPAGPPPAGLSPATLPLAGLSPAGLSPAGLPPAGLPPAGPPPAALPPAALPPAASQATALTRQFAQVIVEILAGSRPLRQTVGWTTDRVRAQIGDLTQLVTSEQRPRIRRIVTSQPAASVVEMTVVISFGPRSRALAMRFEQMPARQPAPGRPARPARWLCTEIETG